MASTLPPPLVKFFVAVLFRERACLDRARELFVQHWGAVDFEGKDHPFDCTDYYVSEMGAPLYRRLLSFEGLIEPPRLVDLKLDCNALEEWLCVEGRRVVNCDAGYLDHNKIVLASAKGAGQKLYLERGIYADLVGRYKAGRYQPFEWSFPDFKTGRYDQELLAIRRIYLDQLKSARGGSS